MCSLVQMKKIVLLFSGLGTQSAFMGRDLYFQNARFREYMDWLDSIAEQLSGKSVIKSYYNDLRKPALDDLFSSQTMLFMVQYSLARLIIDNGIEPDAMMGFSLGEYVAASVAGVLKPDELIALFYQQTRIIENSGLQSSMDLINVSEKTFMESPDLFGNSEIICRYAPKYIIVCTPRDIAGYLFEKWEQYGIIKRSLPVNYPFHTKWMDGMKTALISNWTKIKILEPRISLLSSLSSNTYMLPSVDYFWHVMRQPIAFAESLLINETMGYSYIDCSPGDVCSKYLKYNRVGSMVFSSRYDAARTNRNQIRFIPTSVNTFKDFNTKEDEFDEE